MSREDPDVNVIEVYCPLEKPIRVHLSQVTLCPSELPPGFYWYGTKRCSPCCPPRWVQKLLTEGPDLRDDAVDVSQRQDSSGEITCTPSSLEDMEPPAAVLGGHGNDEEKDSATVDVPEPTVKKQRRYNLRKGSLLQ